MWFLPLNNRQYGTAFTLTGNLNAPSIMIAEKIADEIRGRQPLARIDVPYYVANGAPVRQCQ